MTSRDRKCVGAARKWRHAVRIMLAIFWSLHEVSTSKTKIRRSSPEMAPCCSHTVYNFFALYMKSLAQKLTLEMHFL